MLSTSLTWDPSIFVLKNGREAYQNVLNIEPESQSYDAHIEDLKLVLKATNEKNNTTTT